MIDFKDENDRLIDFDDLIVEKESSSKNNKIIYPH